MRASLAYRRHNLCTEQCMQLVRISLIKRADFFECGLPESDLNHLMLFKYC